MTGLTQDVINHILSFVPRDSQMRSPTAKLMVPCIKTYEKWCDDVEKFCYGLVKPLPFYRHTLAKYWDDNPDDEYWKWVS